MEKKKYDILNITFTALFACIITVCSYIALPVMTVPITLQTFAVFCALLMLGGKNGTVSILIYILLGLIGIPVFSGFKAGPSVLLGPTGGYIIGFLFMGLIYILFTKLINENLPVKVIALAVGLVICYAFGTVWFVVVYNSGDKEIGIKSALMLCVIPFILPDLIKLVMAVFLYKLLTPALKKVTKQGNV